MIICPDCKAENSDGVKFCKGCGTLLKNSSEDKMRCPNGHILDPTWTVCAYCGADVSSINTAQAPITPDSEDYSENPSSRRKTVVENSLNDDEDPFGEIPNNEPSISNRPQKGVTVVTGTPYKETRSQLVGFMVSFSQDSSGKSFEIREGRTFIGKDSKCTISIDDNEMSTEHALLLYRRGKYLLEDRLSTNGTFVNDEEIDDKINLQNYSRIKMGKTEFILIKIQPDQPE